MLALYTPGWPPSLRMSGIIVYGVHNVPAAPPNRPSLHKVVITLPIPPHIPLHILPGKTGLNENFHVHTDVHTYFELMCAICNVDSH